jgi:hypothetical protein
MSRSHAPHFALREVFVFLAGRLIEVVEVERRAYLCYVQCYAYSDE